MSLVCIEKNESNSANLRCNLVWHSGAPKIVALVLHTPASLGRPDTRENLPLSDTHLREARTWSAWTGDSCSSYDFWPPSAHSQASSPARRRGRERRGCRERGPALGAGNLPARCCRRRGTASTQRTVPRHWQGQSRAVAVTRDRHPDHHAAPPCATFAPPRANRFGRSQAAGSRSRLQQHHLGAELHFPSRPMSSRCLLGSGGKHREEIGK